MADLGILSVNTESGIGDNLPSDAIGMLKKCQKNISLSYKKWKKYYKEIEHNRVYALGKLNPRSLTMTSTQNMQEGGRSIKGNIIHATLQGLLASYLC